MKGKKERRQQEGGEGRGGEVKRREGRSGREVWGEREGRPTLLFAGMAE